MDEYSRTEYDDSEYEREANEIAVEILRREGEFQSEVAKMIF